MSIFEDMVFDKLRKAGSKQYKMRNVPGCIGLKWGFWASYAKDNVAHFYIRIIGGCVTVDATVSYHYSNQRGHRALKKYSLDVTKDGEYELGSHTFDMFDAKIYLGCEVKFKLMQWTERTNFAPLTVKEMIDPSDGRCFDTTIAVEDAELKVHRGFLSLISPVFNAAFAPHTKEAQTGILEIKDFPFETVKTAVEYCYGNELKVKSATEVIDMLRFYDKYDIPAAIEKLEVWLIDNMTVYNFPSIAEYAWQYSRIKIQAKCGKVYRGHIADLACSSWFAELDPAVIVGVVRAAAL